jgi:hypothetical protein
VSVLIPFARHRKSGKEVFIDEVESGIACNCICVGCGVEMEARKGEINTHYFAHIKKKVDEHIPCDFNFARSLFWMTRKVLKELKSMNLPQYDFKLESANLENETHTLTDKSNVEINSIEFPLNMDALTHDDVAIINVKGHLLAISISQKISVEKAFWRFENSYNHNGDKIAYLHVQMNGMENVFKTEKRNYKELIKSVFIEESDRKKWLYHPREIPFREEYKKREFEVLSQFRDMVRKNKIESFDSPVYSPPRPSTEPVYTKSSKQNERLTLLLYQANLHFSKNGREALRCNFCHFINNHHNKHCSYCYGKSLEQITMDENFFDSLERKYDCFGYPRTSIEHLPTIVSKLKKENNYQ